MRTPYSQLIALFLFFVSSSFAQPMSERTEVLAQSLQRFDALWDERVGLLWSPVTPAAGASRTHRVRESAWYALGLLQRRADGDVARANRIIEKVLEQQIHSPGDLWHGTFYRAPEEPHVTLIPEVWRDYDPNWRQFIGTTFALMLRGHGDAVVADLQLRMKASIVLALEGELAHQRLSASYTNIAMLQVFLLDYAAQSLGRSEWASNTEALARAVYEEFRVHGTFEEYNSPTYYGVDFFGLALWHRLCANPHIRTWGAEMEAALWRDTAAFYHAGLRNLCAPYDRTYGIDLTRYVSLTGLWLRLYLPESLAPFPAFGGPMDHVHDLAFASSFIEVGTAIPDDAMAAFQTFQQPRQLTRHLPRGRTATAWLEENFMWGGEVTRFGRGTGGVHNQMCPVAVHWRTPDGSLGWIALTESPRLNAVADRVRLRIDGVGDFRFRISAAGARASDIARDRWTLPGLTLTVKEASGGFRVEEKGDGLWVTYTEAAGLEFMREVSR